jgi:hypothetical protein
VNTEGVCELQPRATPWVVAAINESQTLQVFANLSGFGDIQKPSFAQGVALGCNSQTPPALLFSTASSSVTF